MTDLYASKKQLAASWFKTLRNEICGEFESIERDAPVALYPGKPGKFVFEDWQRKVENGASDDLGGGTGGMLRGRVFEKCGVHISVVKGEFTPEMQARQPGADKEPRGIGGIFYDRHNSGDWDADFAFTQDVGRSFKEAYSKIARRRMLQPWTEADREAQLIQRGRYVEFNLLHDRGTTFGLKTGGNVKTILSSMPPVVKWP